ncbi:MAG: bifunctional adenosylcobinamide kinase/adenosylcobinamide-phosphate guanylyltransferase [Rickettsiales bacterium]
MSKINFILGGARSGKSQYAEELASNAGRLKVYVATAEVLDDEMEKRIEIHRARRGNDWKVVEIPIDIPIQITNHSYANSVILVDCLTLWLSNLLHKKIDVNAQIDSLLEALKITQSEVILVSSEVGMGITPENILARQFIDYTGILHQRVAEVADNVVLVVAGIPVKIKGV